MNKSWPKFWVLGALVAGAFDITYATTYSYLRAQMPPAQLLRFVASGALGKDALTGGAGTAALGLGFHFLNAFLICGGLFLVASRVARVRELIKTRTLASGVGFGTFVYVTMTFGVVQLSRIGPRPFPPALPTWTSGLAVHMFLIGLPMVMAAKRALAD